MKRRLMIIGRVAIILLTALLIIQGNSSDRPARATALPAEVVELCAAPKSRKLQRASLWMVTALTLALLAFPYLVPSLPIE
ncbi:MAG: hypothetical protein ACREBD_05355 [Blastocatellia bacterium]